METSLEGGDLQLEKLSREQTICSELKSQELTDVTEDVQEDQIVERLEKILLSRIDDGDKLAPFQLAQLNFEEKRYEEARKYFKFAARLHFDLQAKFQLSVMHYDGLACKEDPVKGFRLMKEVAEETAHDSDFKHIYYPAAYNIGLAYFEGQGVKQSLDQAERWWLIAADDGNPKACIRAQASLGYFYCDDDHRDLAKAFFWFSEACGNGDLEAQGALGVMYYYGLGTPMDHDAAFECLREASERGNVYAQGNLVLYYYQRRLYTKTTQLAAKMTHLNDIGEAAKDTECLPGYIKKGLSLASFIMARCLHKGRGIKMDPEKAKEYYSKSYQYDPDMCAKLQGCANRCEL